jgi:hypothetical protein
VVLVEQSAETLPASFDADDRAYRASQDSTWTKSR